MKQVEIRRHSVRDKPSGHLSSAGRTLAAEVGRARGPFQLCVSSPVLRAVETAEAMGFPPHRLDPRWYDAGEEPLPWPRTFAEYHELARSLPSARAKSAELRGAVESILAELSEGSQALVATHGSFPELASAAWITRGRAVDLGPPCRCMEGVLLEFEARRLRRAEPLRVPPAQTRL